MELPKRYDPKEAEPKWQKFWEENKTYSFNPEDTERKIFSIDTPPPTVSGKMHMGTLSVILNKILLQDIKECKGLTFCNH